MIYPEQNGKLSHYTNDKSKAALLVCVHHTVSKGPLVFALSALGRFEMAYRKDVIGAFTQYEYEAIIHIS